MTQRDPWCYDHKNVLCPTRQRKHSREKKVVGIQIPTLPLTGQWVPLNKSLDTLKDRGAWLVQSGEHETMDLRVVSSSLTLGVELIKNK